MNSVERKIIQELQGDVDKWVRRTLIMSKVLQHLGYRTSEVMGGSKEDLEICVGMDPADIISHLGMRRCDT